MNSRLLSALALAFLCACTSGVKPSEPNVGSQSRTEENRPNDSREAVTDSVPKGSTAEGKYRVLAQAIRGGKPAAIQEEAVRILGTNPGDPVALNSLALIQLRRGKIGAAKLLLGRAFEKNQPTAALHNNLGVTLLEEGDQQAAIMEFKKALQIDDKHPEALGNLGSIYVQAGDHLRALPLLEQSHRVLKSNSAITNNYALALRGNKNFSAAQKTYEEALSLNSKDVSVLLNYAILLIDYMNKPKDGLDLVYKVKFLETERKDVLSRANALEKKAKSELK